MVVALVRNPLPWEQDKALRSACADRVQVAEPAKGDVKAHGVGRRARNVKAPRPPASGWRKGASRGDGGGGGGGSDDSSPS